MQKFVIGLLLIPLIIQGAASQMKKRDADYLYGYETLFLALGATSHGRFFTIGFMPKRYMFELEAVAEPRKIQLQPGISRTDLNNQLGNFLNTRGSDTNIASYVATMRGFYRQKFKFVGALFEVDAGMNVKSWISKSNFVSNESSNVELQAGRIEEKSIPLDYVGDESEFSAGPSLKLKISSGKERGEAVLSIVCNLDLNYFFSKRNPTLNIGLGIMIAPFSY